MKPNNLPYWPENKYLREMIEVCHALNIVASTIYYNNNLPVTDEVKEAVSSVKRAVENTIMDCAETIQLCLYNDLKGRKG